jgi:TonB family protein
VTSLVVLTAVCAAQEVYKVGQGVSEPVPISKAEPDYTEAARQARFSGIVLLRIVIGENGSVRDAKVLSPAPYGLDRQAVAAVLKWRFKPSLKDGKPVPVFANVEVVFRLLDHDRGLTREKLRTDYNHALGLYHGNDVPQDLAKAFELFTKAAESGFIPAQSMLGVMYYRGEGTSKNPQEALRWFTKAAEANDLSGQAHLAALYYMGNGVPQDDSQAARWARKAAERNSPLAQHLLSLMYLDGRGMPADALQAIMWHTLAVKQDYGAAVAAKAQVEAKTTPEQRRDAEKLASKFKPKKK